MSAFVVDASVAIKWFVPEVHSPAARQLLDQPHQYYAPDLIFAEVGNIIWKKIRLRELTPHEGEDLVADMSRCPIDAIPCRALVEDAHALAVRTGRTVYDSLYLALAVRMNTRFITADERFLNAVAAISMLKPHVQLLTTFTG